MEEPDLEYEEYIEPQTFFRYNDELLDDTHFRKWIDVYCEYLYQMFLLIKKSSKTIKINNNFTNFVKFAYFHSSKHISEYA